MIHFSKEEGTTKVYEALWWMSYNCECQWDPEEVEEASDDDSWKSDVKTATRTPGYDQKSEIGTIFGVVQTPPPC